MSGYTGGVTDAAREHKLPRVTGVKNKQAAPTQARRGNHAQHHSRVGRRPMRLPCRRRRRRCSLAARPCPLLPLRRSRPSKFCASPRR